MTREGDLRWMVADTVRATDGSAVHAAPDP
jgi:hypothetical protein